MTDCEELATLMDARTIGCKGIAKSERNAMLARLKTHYADYATTTVKFHHYRAPLDGSDAEDPAKDPDGDKPSEDAPPALPLRGRISRWSSDDEVEFAPPPPPPPTEVDYGAEFDRVFKNYRAYCLDIDWRIKFPDLFKDKPEMYEIDLLRDLFEADMGIIITEMKTSDPLREKFGYLPYMPTGSLGSIGAVLASSFAERINSGENLVFTKGNTLQGDEEINMLVVLRMNRDFMKYMRQYHAHIDRTSFKMVITFDDNDEDEDEVSEVAAPPAAPAEPVAPVAPVKKKTQAKLFQKK